MVQRMANEHPDMTVVSLDPLICPCSTMFRIDGPHLAWVLESLVRGEVVNQITVDPTDRRVGPRRARSACSTSPERSSAAAPQLLTVPERLGDERAPCASRHARFAHAEARALRSTRRRARATTPPSTTTARRSAWCRATTRARVRSSCSTTRRCRGARSRRAAPGVASRRVGGGGRGRGPRRRGSTTRRTRRSPRTRSRRTSTHVAASDSTNDRAGRHPLDVVGDDAHPARHAAAPGAGRAGDGREQARPTRWTGPSSRPWLRSGAPVARLAITPCTTRDARIAVEGVDAGGDAGARRGRRRG